MPRIKNLKGQTFYRIDKNKGYGEIDVLLKKAVDMDLINEQWDQKLREVALFRKMLTPAHVIIQKLANSSLAEVIKSIYPFGKIRKMEYILDYMTNPSLNRKIHVGICLSMEPKNTIRVIIYS